MNEWLIHIPPSVTLMLGALLLPVLHRYLRYGVVLALPVVTLVHLWLIPMELPTATISLAGFDLQLLHIHPYTHIFATAFALAAFAGGLFGLLHSRVVETVAAYIAAGSAIGITFCGDMISMFIYWEMLAISSTFIIFASDRPGAKGAALRYASVHLLGGILLMAGIILQLILTGNIAMVPFNTELVILFPIKDLDTDGVATWMILLGLLVNVAAPPICSWLPDAYPKASPFGSVYLSAFTTKAAVFVLLTLFAGLNVLIYLGVIMIFYGIIYALLENDIRRILAYSIVNQVGFMVVGIGIGSNLALQGVAAHAFCHIMYKALLFMSAGAVVQATGKNKCTELGGIYRSMRFTTLAALIGALAISAFPFTSGFVSKSLISAAVANEEITWLWFALLAASAGVFLHAGVKFPWFVFFHKDSRRRPKDPSWNMQLAMLLLCMLCIIPAVPGVTETTLYLMLPGIVGYQAYSPAHVITQTQLLLFSAVAFFALLPLLKRNDTITLDFDWFYRGMGRYMLLLPLALSHVPVRLAKIHLRRLLRFILAHLDATHGPDGSLARTIPIGTSLTWMMGLLLVYLVVYYV